MRRRQRSWQWLRLPEGLRHAPLSQFDSVAERTEGRNCRDAGRGDDRGEQTAHTYVKACSRQLLGSIMIPACGEWRNLKAKRIIAQVKPSRGWLV